MDDSKPTIFDCGCSRLKVGIGRCDIYGPDGELRMAIKAGDRIGMVSGHTGDPIDVSIGKIRESLDSSFAGDAVGTPSIKLEREQAKESKKAARKREKENRRQMAAVAMATRAPASQVTMTKDERKRQIIEGILAEQKFVDRMVKKKAERGATPEIQKAIDKATIRVVELIQVAEAEGIFLPLPPQVVEALRAFKADTR